MFLLNQQLINCFKIWTSKVPGHEPLTMGQKAHRVMGGWILLLRGFADTNRSLCNVWSWVVVCSVL